MTIKKQIVDFEQAWDLIRDQYSFQVRVRASEGTDLWPEVIYRIREQILEQLDDD